MTSQPTPQTPAARTVRIRGLAREAGFDAAGVAGVESLESGVEGVRFLRWLQENREGTMAYMARDPGRRLDPGRVLSGAISVLCVALNHGPHGPELPAAGGRGDGPDGGSTGRIARYARGRDYHKIFTRRLTELERALIREFPGVATRRYVDTGPVLEKLWAERAGLGWRGKHTNLVSRDFGSWLLLGEILLDLELLPDVPEADYCGTCSRCLDACPTNAFPAPYELDARRCLSYLTIEHRGSIPVEFRAALGDRVFGCDDCLVVCPWNRFAREAREAEFRPRAEALAPLLAELVAMDETGFRRRYAGTAVLRAKREGLARNACVALGNVGDARAAPVLERAMADASGIVREHAAWGLLRLSERGVI